MVKPLMRGPGPGDDDDDDYDGDGNSYDAGVVRRVERDNLLSELNQL